ncbi:MAG: response regulator [Candidatus Omnitrophica bacterium]|nr:response regulator [Candidatus Omnitrophota bacterium]
MAKKILIVDDEVNITKVLASRLNASGYDSAVAYDGQEALDKVEAEKPDLIILDLMLPKIEGYRVCRLLKFDKKYQHIPIIIFTARAQPYEKTMAESVGADAYITKPFEPDILLKKIDELLYPKHEG